jgi:hypothetical protein
MKVRAEQRQMLEIIQAHVRQTAGLTGCGKLSAPVLRAMAGVPRGVFVPDSLRPLAWADCPLLIGHGQTISQPFICRHRGGSGYAAAVARPTRRRRRTFGDPAGAA